MSMEQSQNRLLVSTVLLTRNSGKTLPAYFESMKDVDDIILLDGGSTDDTLEIAKKHPNVRVFPQNPKFLNAEGYIIDFSGMRNEGYTYAKHPWVLCIDSDEQLSPALEKEVRRIVREGKPGVYFVKRTFLWNGKPVVQLTGAGYDHIRLFHKEAVRGCVKPIHERLDIIPGAYRGTLDAPVFVPLPPKAVLRPKFNRFLNIELTYQKNIPFGRWFRWLFIRNLIAVPRMFLVWCLTWLVPKIGPRYPWKHQYEQMRYNVILTVRACPILKS
jgi:glycosyltransferase involved in cell wall biosynthesis